jgi:hypothetical protein
LAATSSLEPVDQEGAEHREAEREPELAEGFTVPLAIPPRSAGAVDSTAADSAGVSSLAPAAATSRPAIRDAGTAVLAPYERLAEGDGGQTLERGPGVVARTVLA